MVYLIMIYYKGIKNDSLFGITTKKIQKDLGLSQDC